MEFKIGQKIKIPNRAPYTENSNAGWGEYKKEQLGLEGEILSFSKYKGQIRIETNLGDHYWDIRDFESTEKLKPTTFIINETKKSNKDLLGL